MSWASQQQIDELRSDLRALKITAEAVLKEWINFMESSFKSTIDDRMIDLRETLDKIEEDERGRR